MNEYKIIQGDCLEVMRGMEANSVDIVITDPPYGINENYKKNLSREKLAKPKDYGQYNWDTIRVSKEYISEIMRVSKQQVIFGGNYYADMLPPSSSWIVWDKDNGDNDFADCELAWTSHKKAVRKIRWKWSGFLKEKPEERVHPTQKPIGVMNWIIVNYTKEGDTILDPFCGSGSTGVAALQMGRNFIGIELNSDYVELSRKRIGHSMPLFSKNT